MAFWDSAHHPIHHEPLVDGDLWHDFIDWCRSVADGQTVVSFVFGAIVTASALVFLVPMMLYG